MECYDVIIVGLGVMGAATARALAARGASVLAVDARPPLHNQGSSHGKTRATRESYFESPQYVPLMQEAHRLWRGLEDETGADLLTMNGGAYLGPPDHPVLAGVRRAADQHALALEVYSPTQMMDRHPGFQIPPDWQGLIERSSGVLRAEACLKAFHSAARTHGAELRFGEPMRAWRAADAEVTVEFDHGAARAKSLVLTLGPWAVEGLGFDLPISGRRVTVAHFDTARPDHYANDDLGVFFWATPMGIFGGFQHIEGQGVKLLRHDEGGACTPDTILREVTEDDLRAFTRFSSHYLPDVGDKLMEAYTCIYTMTPDDHFIIDHHPHSKNVHYATGFSGHGFKFAPIIGEVLGDLALTGETGKPVGFLKASRFA